MLVQNLYINKKNHDSFAIVLRHDGINFIVKHLLEGCFTLNSGSQTMFSNVSPLGNTFPSQVSLSPAQIILGGDNIY